MKVARAGGLEEAQAMQAMRGGDKVLLIGTLTLFYMIRAPRSLASARGPLLLLLFISRIELPVYHSTFRTIIFVCKGS